MPRRLQSVPAAAPSSERTGGLGAAGASLDFTLMAAVKHAEEGDWTPMLDALLTAIWLQHKGCHEQLGDDRVRHHLRQLGGVEWLPPEAA